MGTNRPGRRALRELAVRSPLEEARLSKAEVRELSKALGLPTWDDQLKVRARPEQLLKQMEGSVWEWTVTSQELPALKQQFLVSSTLRRLDGLEVRVVSETQPCPEAQPVTPSLEDVYLAMVAQHQGGPA